MRILNIIASVDPAGGGPIEGILQQAETRAFAGHTSEIVSIDAPDAPWVAACPVKTYAMGALPLDERRRRIKFLPWLRYGASRKFVAWLSQHQSEYDAIVVHGLWNFTTLGFTLAGLGRGTPYVVFAHGMLDPWFRRTYPLKHLAKSLFWLLADGWVTNGADAVLFTCEEERLQARNAFWPYRPTEHVVSFGSGDAPPDAENQRAAFAALLPALGDRPYLLFLSRIHPKKGCDLLVDAFVTIARGQPELDLVIAGPDQAGLREDLQHRAEAAGVGHRIHWPGMVTGPAKWGAFRGARAFVLPSHQENFGIVVAEAMACGRPVLISNKVNIWREVEGAGAGLVEADTAEGTVRLLERFLALTDDDLSQMSASARAGYQATFSMDGAAKDLIDFLSATVAGRALRLGGAND